MKVFRFVTPYLSNGKTRFPDRKKCGVYLIRENGKIVFVGYSENDLYRTMYRHFQTWNHTGQEVAVYQGNFKGSGAGRSQSRYKPDNKITVRVVYGTAKQARALEIWLIQKIKPRDNADHYLDWPQTRYLQLVGQIYQESEIEPLFF